MGGMTENTRQPKRRSSIGNVPAMSSISAR
jgi:hypothetical protein